MDENSTENIQQPPSEKPGKKRLPTIYWGYLLLLAASLTLFTLYSIKCDDTTYSFELRKMEVPQLAESGERKAESGDVKTEIGDVKTEIGERRAESSRPAWADTATVIKRQHYSYSFDTNEDDDSCGVRFLLIGDSMNEYLRMRLNDYCIANGYRMHCVIWYGSTTKQFGTCDTLAYFIRKYRPTNVLLTIGANELFVRDIIRKRTPYVQHIIDQLGNIPYVWIGPPNWKDDTGINELIVTHVGESRYFESKKLSFDRCSDGAHPTRTSAYKWMDEIAKYLSTEANPTMAMNTPDTSYNKIPRTTILKMVRE